MFTLEEPIVNGRGKIHVDDSTWRVEGEDCPKGARVRVTDAEGVILKVSRSD
jgi:membrane protein implicated in regulation of membrane protease activity